MKTPKTTLFGKNGKAVIDNRHHTIVAQVPKGVCAPIKLVIDASDLRGLDPLSGFDGFGEFGDEYDFLSGFPGGDFFGSYLGKGRGAGRSPLSSLAGIKMLSQLLPQLRERRESSKKPHALIISGSTNRESESALVDDLVIKDDAISMDAAHEMISYALRNGLEVDVVDLEGVLNGLLPVKAPRAKYVGIYAPAWYLATDEHGNLFAQLPESATVVPLDQGDLSKFRDGEGSEPKLEELPKIPLSEILTAIRASDKIGEKLPKWESSTAAV